jgi:hypothetical protein
MSENQNEQQIQTSNAFEDPHDKRNDLIDSGVGFVVTFGFFMLIFVIFVIFEVIRDLS